MTQIATQASSTTETATRPRLVLFHSKRCGRCRRVEAYVAQVLQRRRNHATFALVQVDADQRPDLVARFHIDEVPTLLVVADKRVQRRLAHPRGCHDIEELLAQWLQ
jgi:thioredoxin-like negative regulator of GroEL